MRGTQFAEMSAFVAVAERQSFAKAATQLGIGRSTLSQNLRALEERLGVRLLNRTTRSVSLTEAGARLLARVRPSLVELDAAVSELADYRGGPSGLLRIAVQPPVATLLIEPMLARFLREYPSIQLDIAVIKMPADIIAEGFERGYSLGRTNRPRHDCNPGHERSSVLGRRLTRLPGASSAAQDTSRLASS